MVDYEKDFRNENGEFEYIKSPLRAIKAKCLYDCCAGNRSDLENCTCKTCFLYPFRFGKNTFSKRRTKILTDEQINALKERMHKTQLARKQNNV